MARFPSFECRLGPFALRDWLFYLAFALCAFGTLVLRTMFDAVLGIPKEPLVRACYALGVALLCVRLVSCHRTHPARFALALVLAAAGAVSFAVAQDFRCSMAFLFVAAGQGVRLKPLAAIALGVQLAVLAVTLPCALLGVVDSVQVWRLADGSWYPRSSFGYSHPNMLGQVFLSIALSCAVLRFPRFAVPDALAFAACFAGAAFLVQARTAMTGIVLAGVCAALAPWATGTPQRRRTMAIAALVLAAAAAGVSLAMMVLFDPEVSWMQQANELASNRFALANRYFQRFSVEPFGHRSMMVVLDDFIQYAPDNAYVRLFMKEGFVPFLLLGSLGLGAFSFAVRRRIYDACVMGLAVYAVVAVMEMYALNFTIDYFLIGLSWVLYGCWPVPDMAKGGKQ